MGSSRITSLGLRTRARAIADEVMVLKDGRVVERGPASAVFDAPREPYTRALMAAAFQLAAIGGGAVRE